MHFKTAIRKLSVVLLIVVFSIKAGTGLYLHNYFHTKNFSSSTTGSAEVKFTCSCVSDFYLPFEETVQPSVDILSHNFLEHNYSYTSFLLYTTKLYTSLRAPPANS